MKKLRTILRKREFQRFRKLLKLVLVDNYNYQLNFEKKQRQKTQPYVTRGLLVRYLELKEIVKTKIKDLGFEKFSYMA